ncbi:hypothetical protein OH76DRAFT_702045 [Lentinus brumalis]|uniref:Uncharacterized protein n=1 Tax=Lentinus brumalis TaxID=2498619 RepID=A0A371D5N4_9APHY|nr:hypothetical protein OH76DRAFT_702045 [Polyporus brumalis]
MMDLVDLSCVVRLGVCSRSDGRRERVGMFSRRMPAMTAVGRLTASHTPPVTRGRTSRTPAHPPPAKAPKPHGHVLRTGRTQKARRDRNTTVPASTKLISVVAGASNSPERTRLGRPSSLFPLRRDAGSSCGEIDDLRAWYVPSVRRSYIGVLASEAQGVRASSGCLLHSARVDRVRCLARVREQHVRPAAAPVLPRCRLQRAAEIIRCWQATDAGCCDVRGRLGGGPGTLGTPVLTSASSVDIGGIYSSRSSRTDLRADHSSMVLAVQCGLPPLPHASHNSVRFSG